MKKFRFLPDGYPSGEPLVGEDVADKGLALGMLGAMEACLREASHRHGWDRPPCLGFLALLSRDPVTPQATREAMLMEWLPLPNSEAALSAQSNNMAAVPVFLATSIRTKAIETPAPPGLVAAMLISEAWAVSTKGEDLNRFSEDIENRTLYKHPDRVEVKTASAVDTHGVMYMVMRPRDPDYPTVSIANIPGGPGVQAGGDVPVSLLYLMKAIQGSTLPDYETFSQNYAVTLQG